jgi:predicted transcriptional regulator YheO
MEQRKTGMFKYDQLEQVFELLARVGEAVAATVGPNCEVVVHDLRTPEHTVVAISGNLTRRAVGAPVPDPELLPGNVDRFQEDLLHYKALTPGGRELVSSTVWVRDTRNHIVGALCINMDFANLRLARDLLTRAIADVPSSKADGGLTTFATSPEEFAAIALKQVIQEIDRPLHQLDRDDKIQVIGELDKAGVFALRRAADIVASELGVSRASVYSYLKDARGETSEVVAPGRRV